MSQTGSEVVVVFGGASGERRVSVASAQHIVEVLGLEQAWFVDPEGRVYPCASAVLLRHERPFERDFLPDAAPAYPTLGAALDAVTPPGPVFVLAFHGGAGEDGTIQFELERRGLAFTGSGAAASARAFDKRTAKEVVAARGVRTADACIVSGESPAKTRAELARLLARHGRVVVKPVADGSSVGLHHVRSAEDLDAVVSALASTPSTSYLAEAFVQGTEMTVGVVDGPSGTRALPPSEVRLDPGRAFDFEGKYLGRGTTEITPAEVPAATARAAQALACTAHTALGCAGYSRTDVIADAHGVVFLETNTLPGLTRASFLPQQLAAEGTSVRAFLDGQIALARARQRGAG